MKLQRIWACAPVGLLAASLFAGCGGLVVPLAPPTSVPVVTTTARPATTTAPPTTSVAAPPTSTGATAPATTTSAAATGVPGLVTLNNTFTDDGTGVTTTVVAATPFVKALPQWGDPSLDAIYVRMMGVQLSVDISKEKFFGVSPLSSNFAIRAGDGTSIKCGDVLPGAKYKTFSDAILAAFGGGTAYKMDFAAMKGAGWIICTTAGFNDKAFDSPKVTIRYTRAQGKTTGGDIIPAFTIDIPVSG